jgi:hypothetical protein
VTSPLFGDSYWPAPPIGPCKIDHVIAIIVEVAEPQSLLQPFLGSSPRVGCWPHSDERVLDEWVRCWGTLRRKIFSVHGSQIVPIG